MDLSASSIKERAAKCTDQKKRDYFCNFNFFEKLPSNALSLIVNMAMKNNTFQTNVRCLPLVSKAFGDEFWAAVTDATFTVRNEAKSKVISKVLRRGVNLKSLKVQYDTKCPCIQLPAGLTQLEVTGDKQDQHGVGWPLTLETVHAGSLQSLKHLSIVDYCHIVPDLDSLLAPLTNLETLVLRGLVGVADDDSISFLNGFAHMKNLKALYFGVADDSDLQTLNPKDLQPTKLDFSNLLHLETLFIDLEMNEMDDVLLLPASLTALGIARGDTFLSASMFQNRPKLQKVFFEWRWARELYRMDDWWLDMWSTVEEVYVIMDDMVEPVEHPEVVPLPSTGLPLELCVVFDTEICGNEKHELFMSRLEFFSNRVTKVVVYVWGELGNDSAFESEEDVIKSVANATGCTNVVVAPEHKWRHYGNRWIMVDPNRMFYKMFWNDVCDAHLKI